MSLFNEIFEGIFSSNRERYVERVEIIEDLSEVKPFEPVFEDWSEGNPNKIEVTNYEYLFSRIFKR